MACLVQIARQIIAKRGGTNTRSSLNALENERYFLAYPVAVLSSLPMSATEGPLTALFATD
jgi:hypothetical protein